jgi:hopene-associated glycosyltransferase HpnB
MFVLNFLLALGLLAWLLLAILHAGNAIGLTLLDAGQPAVAPAALPKVSIILAARNEEDALPAALDSLLNLAYPDYEIVLVDDDSTDRTGAIADAYARRSAGRLTVIHKHARPADWSGKVHALHTAAQKSQGEWLLATDADVVHHPQALARGMALALGRRLDLLSLAPQIEMSSFWECAVLPLFALGIASAYPVFLVNCSRFRRATAVGAFILLRRRELESLGGYAQIKGTVIDDLRLAQLFKDNGRRICLAATRGLLRTRMYRSAGEVWEGLRRTAFEAMGFSVLKVLAALALIFVTGILPWLTVLAATGRGIGPAWAPPLHPTLLLAFAACGMNALVYLPFLLILRVSPLYVFTFPLAAVFYTGVTLDSMVSSLFRTGVRWKGRDYPPPA